MESAKSFRCYHGSYSPARRPLVTITRPMVKIHEQQLISLLNLPESPLLCIGMNGIPERGGGT